MLIEFKRNGKAKQMNPKLARVLEKKGHIRIVDVGVETVAQTVPVIEKALETKTDYDAMDLVSQAITESVIRLNPDIDAMDIEALRQTAAAMNIPVHHRAGADKIRADIRAKM